MKIGLGVITCNRENYFKQCLASIPLDKIDYLVTVNDGKEYSKIYSANGKADIIQHSENKSVCISKNEAMKAMLDNGCDHIFLLEDDIKIKNKEVFNRYIECSKESGLQHMMFGYHGPANMRNGKPTPRLIIEYKNNVKIALNTHCVGALCYYSRKVLEDVGLMDENFNKNCWEHVDHSLQIVKKGYIPAYWWWPDIADSYDYLEEVAGVNEGVIIKNPDHRKNIAEKAEYFRKKNGLNPVQIKDIDSSEVIEILRKIKSL